MESELQTARTLDEAQTTVPHLGQLSRSLAALGQEAETELIIQEFLTLNERTPYGHAYSIPSLLPACRWLVHRQATSEALESLQFCLQQLERLEAQLQSLESAAGLAEARGLAAVYNQQPALAVEQFQRVAAHWANLNRPYDQARVLHDLGQALNQTKDTPQAQSAFKQALDLIERLADQLEEPELKASFLHSARCLTTWTSASSDEARKR
ncbi:MAG TPA: tetratricopeptide repeat protein [Anaerolineae bacterium]|nr:tetratricopeptide repeat protein [Anaerolineae bacterium]